MDCPFFFWRTREDFHRFPYLNNFFLPAFFSLFIYLFLVVSGRPARMWDPSISALTPAWERKDNRVPDAGVTRVLNFMVAPPTEYSQNSKKRPKKKRKLQETTSPGCIRRKNNGGGQVIKKCHISRLFITVFTMIIFVIMCQFRMRNCFYMMNNFFFSGGKRQPPYSHWFFMVARATLLKHLKQ